MAVGIRAAARVPGHCLKLPASPKRRALAELRQAAHLPRKSADGRRRCGARATVMPATLAPELAEALAQPSGNFASEVGATKRKKKGAKRSEALEKDILSLRRAVG